MNITVRKAAAVEVKADALIVGVPAGARNLTGAVAAVDKATGGGVKAALGYPDFDAAAGQTVWLPAGKAAAQRVLLVGLGKLADFKAAVARKAAAAAARAAMDARCKNIAIAAFAAGKLGDEACASACAEGIGMATYEPGMHQTRELEKRKPLLTKVALVTDDQAHVAALRKGVERGEALAGGVNFTRDLVNHPSNKLTPRMMAAQAKQLASLYDDITVKVWGEKEILKAGMGGLYGVGQGSEEESQFIMLEYKPKAVKNPKTIAFVGKGLTFDTGGISIKPAAGMELMKFDMGGAGAVLGGFHILGALRPKVRVLGYIASAENMPDGRAIKPGDLLTMMNGLTVEVNNTDAEGRLVLGDAIHYAKQQKPEFIVDAATLTGACMIALGDVACGVMSEDDDLVKLIQEASDASGDAVWRLPLQQKHRDLMKGHVADLINTGPREGGALTAAGFLSYFAEGARWAHLDIAGTVWTEKAQPDNPKGATGFGARLFAAIAEVAGERLG